LIFGVTAALFSPPPAAAPLFGEIIFLKEKILQGMRLCITRKKGMN
jgi:hypothetical protein